MMRRGLVFLIVAGALAACDGDPTPLEPLDAGGTPLEPLAPGTYVLAGEATLESGVMRTERLVLFVPEVGSDAPMYLRNTRWDRMSAVTFAAGATVSDPLSGCAPDALQGSCSVRVEADTGCAVFEYTGDYADLYPAPDEPCQDGYHVHTGALRACPTGEAFVPELFIEGGLHRSAILSGGRVSVRATYPLDEVADTFEVRIDGAPHDFTRAAVSPDRFVMELGPIEIGADVAITYTGARPVAPTPPTAMATTAVLTDLTLESAPPDGAIDARGQPVRFEDGALHIDDEGHCPRVPFVAAMALGDPGSATALRVEFVHGERRGSFTEARLVRDDWSSGAPMSMRNGPLEVPVPPGTGPVWLVLENRQDLSAPGDYADPAVLRIDSLEWR